MCHFLPVYHLGIVFLGRGEGSKYNRFWKEIELICWHTVKWFQVLHISLIKLFLSLFKKNQLYIFIFLWQFRMIFDTLYTFQIEVCNYDFNFSIPIFFTIGSISGLNWSFGIALFTTSLRWFYSWCSGVSVNFGWGEFDFGLGLYFSRLVNMRVWFNMRYPCDDWDKRLNWDIFVEKYNR